MWPGRSEGVRRRPGGIGLSRSTVVAISVVLVVGGLAGVPAGAQPPDPSSLRLFAVNDRITVPARASGWAWVDLGTWITPVGGDFELWAHRATYRDPVLLRQVDPETKEVVRELSPDLMHSWFGLRRFLRMTVLDASGARVSRRTMTFCPGGWWRERVSDEGRVNPRYPSACWGMPLTRGVVWGIDDHWAVNALSEDGGILLRRGRYTVSVEIHPTYRDLLGISDEDGSVDITVVVRRRAAGVAGVERPAEEVAVRSGPVPEVTDPDPGTLPDLQVLPAWGLGTRHRNGREYLTFASTAWNEGPAPLVVEGFRPPGEATMEAYQYFYQDGDPVGRAPAGTFEWDPRPGHHHWHFTQFVRYSLLDASGDQAVRSRKESFCLFPTDPVDLTVEGAQWSWEGSGLGSRCGSRGSIWIREVLQSGWGDTYYQWIPSQAFDITGLPNGRYFVKMQVNPDGALHDGDPTNDTSLRRIRLGGKPGKRRVVVPLWNGIDTEGGGCLECFFSTGPGGRDGWVVRGG